MRRSRLARALISVWSAWLAVVLLGPPVDHGCSVAQMHGAMSGAMSAAMGPMAHGAMTSHTDALASTDPGSLARSGPDVPAPHHDDAHCACLCCCSTTATASYAQPMLPVGRIVAAREVRLPRKAAPTTRIDRRLPFATAPPASSLS